MRGRLRKWAAPLLTYALPPRCAGCGAVVELDDSFCLSCWQQIDFLGQPCCVRCGVPFEHDMGVDAECGACLAQPPPFDSARAATAYGPVTREIALRLKYGRRIGLARLMARFMAHVVPDAAKGAADWMLIPVPLHRWRQWQRGFNQSAMVADHLAKNCTIPVDKLALVRHRATPSLRSLNGRQRERAVKGAFRVDPRRSDTIRNKHILLVDDVHTSGATASACVSALRRAGVASVHLLCWARVLDND